MTMRMTNIKIFGFCWLIVFSGSQAFAEENENLTEFGDAMQFVLPLTAWGATFIYDDQPGRFQFYKHALTSLTITTAAKGISAKTRPDASSSKTSFPSGHTTGAFLGATFLNTRYGMAWGIPAYTLATITAYSRVQADKHHVDDVIAGASVAFFSNLYWVTPFDSNVTVTPTVIGDTTGIAVTVTDGSLLLAYQFNPLWDAAIGYSYYERDIETSTLANHAQYDILTFVTGYSFH